jgi:hypothetical protein
LFCWFSDWQELHSRPIQPRTNIPNTKKPLPAVRREPLVVTAVRAAQIKSMNLALQPKTARLQPKLKIAANPAQPAATAVRAAKRKPKQTSLIPNQPNMPIATNSPNTQMAAVPAVPAALAVRAAPNTNRTAKLQAFLPLIPALVAENRRRFLTLH